MNNKNETLCFLFGVENMDEEKKQKPSNCTHYIRMRLLIFLQKSILISKQYFAVHRWQLNLMINYSVFCELNFYLWTLVRSPNTQNDKYEIIHFKRHTNWFIKNLVVKYPIFPLHFTVSSFSKDDKNKKKPDKIKIYMGICCSWPENRWFSLCVCVARTMGMCKKYFVFAQCTLNSQVECFDHSDKHQQQYQLRT